MNVDRTPTDAQISNFSEKVGDLKSSDRQMNGSIVVISVLVAT